MTAEPQRALINGALVTGRGGRTLPNVNPSTEEVIGSVTECEAEDMRDAIGAARRAFDELPWRHDNEFRRKALAQLREGVVAELESIRRTLVAECGCPIALTRTIQLDFQLPMLEWWERLATEYQYETWPEDLVGGNKRRLVLREPIGVVAAITAYNVPLQLIVAKLGPALAAGNTVVLKPAPQTPFVAAAIARIIAEHTEIPAGVVNIVPSSDPAVAEVLTTDPRVDMVSFTGSTNVGRKIMANASGTVKRLFLELGGKSPYVVLDDADLEKEVRACVAGLLPHAGQGCGRTTRLLVPERDRKAAAEIAAEAMAAARFGDPYDPEIVIGPLISEQQREKVASYVAGAIADRSSLRAGGAPPQEMARGFYYRPTLVDDVDPYQAIAQEEIFGPVLCLLGYDGDADAARIANATPFGLAGVVASASESRALEMARRIKSGVVIVNGGLIYGPDSPFGGTKQSGIGREMGIAGFEEYLDLKNIALPS